MRGHGAGSHARRRRSLIAQCSRGLRPTGKEMQGMYMAPLQRIRLHLQITPRKESAGIRVGQQCLFGRKIARQAPRPLAAEFSGRLHSGTALKAETYAVVRNHRVLVKDLPRKRKGRNGLVASSLIVGVVGETACILTSIQCSSVPRCSGFDNQSPTCHLSTALGAGGFRWEFAPRWSNLRDGVSIHS
jgi:hypothetical protein